MERERRDWLLKCNFHLKMMIYLILAIILPHTFANLSQMDALHAMAQSANNASLFWGTYRPNLYFGVKPRGPDSFLPGLMWFGLSDYSGVQRNIVLWW
jgi:hypothetical protein